MSVKHATQVLEDEVAKTGQQLAEDAKDKVTPVLSAVRDKVSAISEQLKVQAKDNAQTVDRYVRDNPWSFIGLGVVTGFLAAWYFSNRSR